jgi:hypothetical protein
VSASSSPAARGRGGEEELGLVVVLCSTRLVVDMLGTMLWWRSFPRFDSGGERGMRMDLRDEEGARGAVKPCRYFSHLFLRLSKSTPLHLL